MTVYCVFWVENGTQFLERIFVSHDDAVEYGAAMGATHYGHWNIESWEVE